MENDEARRLRRHPSVVHCRGQNKGRRNCHDQALTRERATRLYGGSRSVDHGDRRGHKSCLPEVPTTVVVRAGSLRDAPRRRGVGGGRHPRSRPRTYLRAASTPIARRTGWLSGSRGSAALITRASPEQLPRGVLNTRLPAVDYPVIQRETSASAHRRTDKPNGPVRTCVGCRKRELAVGLLRVVAVSTGNGKCAVIVDSAGNLPGRGAWLHPAPQCAGEAIQRRAFTRALRITGSPDTSAVVEHVESLGVLGPPGNRTGSKDDEHTVKSR